MKILISSCSKYVFVRNEVIKTIHSVFPQAYIYIVTELNDISTNSKNIQFLKIEDKGWSSNLIALIEAIDLPASEHAILWMDDLAIDASGYNVTVVQDLVFRLYEANKLLSLKLYLNPNERIVKLADTSVGIISGCGNSEYPVSTMVSIFNVGFLKRILRSGESAWDFERNALNRIKYEELQFLAQLNFNFISIRNLVVQGKLVPWRMKNLHHPGMSFLESLIYKLKIILNLIRLLNVRDLFNYMTK